MLINVLIAWWPDKTDDPIHVRARFLTPEQIADYALFGFEVMADLDQPLDQPCTIGPCEDSAS